MNLTKRQILKLIYEQQVWDSETPAEVVPVEDAWGTGEDLEHHVDWQEEETGEAVESGIEIEEIVERLRLKMRLKRIVHENLRKR
jgi:hypothetical protein